MTPAVQTVRSAAKKSPSRVWTPSARDPRDLLPGVDLDAERLELARGRGLQPFRQRRQHARRRLDQADLDVGIGVEAAQAVADELARGVAELGGELDPGRPAADDREAQAPAAARAVARGVAVQKAAEDLAMDALGLGGAAEIQAVLVDAGHAEVVEHAADRDHQEVVAEPPPGHQLGAARIADRVEHDLAPRPIEAAHLAELEAEAVARRMREVVEAIGLDRQRAGRDLVQQRLPDVGQRAVDERDARPLAAPEPIAEPGREHEPAGAAAHDHDARRERHLRTGCRRCRRAALERASASCPESLARAPAPARRSTEASAILPR